MQGDAFNSGLSFNANKRSKKNEFTNKTNGVKVLIVDDSTKALIPLNLIFLSLGCETILTFDGNDAIREILIHWPDLIILDWRMPKVNGGEAIARTQRTLDYDYPHLDIRRNKSISVVTFTAHNQENLELPVCKNFEFVSHWQKPISAAELARKATKIISNLRRV